MPWFNLIDSVIYAYCSNPGEYKVWTPSKQIVSTVNTFLLRNQSAIDSLSVEPAAPTLVVTAPTLAEAMV